MQKIQFSPSGRGGATSAAAAKNMVNSEKRSSKKKSDMQSLGNNPSASAAAVEVGFTGGSGLAAGTGEHQSFVENDGRTGLVDGAPGGGGEG